MLIKTIELKANPFRDITNYPINKDKVNTLQQSIEQTGFWDNILARKKNGSIEIAYGHHRLEAIKQAGLETVDIPVKDLDDATMLKIMANENQNEFDTSPIVIQETVRAVRDFLQNSIEKHIGYEEIQEFLGNSWRGHVIKNALIIINSIEQNKVDEQAVNSLPTLEHATRFVSNVKSAGVPKSKQKYVAREIIKESNPGVKDVASKVYNSKYAKNVTQRKYNTHEMAAKIRGKINVAATALNEMKTLVNEGVQFTKYEIYDISKAIKQFEDVANSLKLKDNENITV